MILTIKERLKVFFNSLGINIEKQLRNFSPFKGSPEDQSHLKNVYILSPEASKLYVKQEKASKNQNEIIGYGRTDLLGYDLLSINAVEKEKKILSGLKLALPKEDIEALSVAITIKKYESHGRGNEAMRLRNKLRDRFQERGNRIYNFYSSGLLNEFLEFSVSLLLFTPTINERRKVKELFDKCIDYQEYAIFVNSWMSKDSVVLALMRRFNVDNVEIVIIFGRTLSILKKIEIAIHEFIEEQHLTGNGIYQVKQQIYQMGDIPNAVYNISFERKSPVQKIYESEFSSDEVAGIEIAISESEKCTSEDRNIHPKVGAVLIKGKNLLTAYRGEINPGEHAEYTLLNKCHEENIDISGATIITTLEPCTKRGHPKVPCAQLILNKGISKVIIGTIDPNPDIRGKGCLFLEENEITVQHFPYEHKEQVKEINNEFWKYQCKKYRRDLMTTPTE